MTALPVGFPTGPLFDIATGEVTPAWRQFFVALWQRTGSAVGVVTTDTASLQASLAAETTARQTADAGLTNAIAQERGRAESVEGALTSDLQIVGYSLQSQITTSGTYVRGNFIQLEASGTPYKISTMPDIDLILGPTLDGTEKLAAEMGGANYGLTFGTLLRIIADWSGYVSGTSPLNGTAANPTGDPWFANAGNAFAGSNNAGRLVQFLGGAGDGSGAGGDAFVGGGAGGDTGNGGAASLVAGIGGATSGNGGAAQLLAGSASGSGSGGALSLAAGDGASGGDGGAASLASGWGDSAGNGADLSLSAGGSFGAGNGGNVYISTGSAGGTRGNIILDTQTVYLPNSNVVLEAGAGNFTLQVDNGVLNLCTFSVGWDVNVFSGTTGSGATGAAFIFSGDAAGSNISGAAGAGTGSTDAGNSGQAYLYTGDSTNADTGAVNISSGNATSGTSGVVTVVSGPGATSGDFFLQSGPSSAGNSGAVNLQSGNATGGDSGNVILQSGTATGTRGSIIVDAFAVTSPAGMYLQIQTGDESVAATPSQDFFMFTGAPGAGANSGAGNFGTGDAASGGNSGDIFFYTGNSSGGNSGNVNIQSGTAAGTRGDVVIDGANVKFGAAQFAANAAVATVLGSVGPAGSHTTVQEWFAIKNASGTVRYIPAF